MDRYEKKLDKETSEGEYNGIWSTRSQPITMEVSLQIPKGAHESYVPDPREEMGKDLGWSIFHNIGAVESNSEYTVPMKNAKVSHDDVDDAREAVFDVAQKGTEGHK